MEEDEERTPVVVKEEIDVGPTQLQRVDMFYNLIPVKSESIEDGTVAENYTGQMNSLESDAAYNTELPQDPAVAQKHKKNDGEKKGEDWCFYKKNIFDTKCTKQIYECLTCNIVYKLKSSLMGHIFNHQNQTRAGEKSYECSFCNKRFIKKNNLTRHIRTHTGEQPFECVVCYKRFIQKSKLTSHIRPFECSFCHKRFTQKHVLTTHTKIHTGEKPFECVVCHKRFIEKSKLTTHIRTHTGEKPF